MSLVRRDAALNFLTILGKDISIDQLVDKVASASSDLKMLMKEIVAYFIIRHF